MLFFKKRTRIEDFAAELVAHGIPRACAFFSEENGRARFHLSIPESDLTNIGGGVCLFFLAPHLKREKKDDPKRLQRATRAIRRAINKLGGNSDKAQDWWKAIDDDARIIHSDEDRLEAACKAVWNRTFRDRSYKEHGALRSFIYFLQVEVSSVTKLKLV